MSFEYVTDVAYVRHFEADLAPMRLRQVAALNGFAPPPAEDFDYCELGMGRGDTLVALAAANLRGRFVGIDLMPDHVQSARDFAAQAGLDNVQVLAADFAAQDLPASAQGPFDYIVAHGVMSWVGPDKRDALIQYAQRTLKPGGLLFVTYNALPGWAALEPLRQLLASGTHDGSVARAKAGLELAQKLAAAKAQYFEQTPAARDMLAKLATLDLAYVAHEYLHAHWQPMYFAQVSTPMAAAGLRFAGVQPLFLNYRDLAVPAATASLFAELADRIAFESLKDFALNEYFRRDVYVSGTNPQDSAHTERYLQETSFVAAAEGVPDDPDVRLLHHTLHFEEPVYQRLFAALAEGAQTGAALVRRLDLAELGKDTIHAALLRMVVGAHIAPVKRSTRGSDVDPNASFRVPSAFNRLVLEQQGDDRAPLMLASPLAGTAVPITPLQVLVLRVLLETPPSGRAARLRELAERAQMQKDGKPLATGRERIEEVERVADELYRERLGKLVELQILEAVT